MAKQDWKKEIARMLLQGCNKEDVKYYCIMHPAIPKEDIWQFAYEITAPEKCLKCEHIDKVGFGPRNMCPYRLDNNICI